MHFRHLPQTKAAENKRIKYINSLLEITGTDKIVLQSNNREYQQARRFFISEHINKQCE